MRRNIISAIKNTIITFAALHIFILAFLSFVNQEISYLNVFNILDLQIFFPGIDKGLLSTTLSIIIPVLIFAFYYQKKKS